MGLGKAGNDPCTHLPSSVLLPTPSLIAFAGGGQIITILPSVYLSNPGKKIGLQIFSLPSSLSHAQVFPSETKLLVILSLLPFRAKLLDEITKDVNRQFTKIRRFERLKPYEEILKLPNKCRLKQGDTTGKQQAG